MNAVKKLAVLTVVGLLASAGAVAEESSGSDQKGRNREERMERRGKRMHKKLCEDLGISEEKAKKVAAIMKKARERGRKHREQVKSELSKVLTEEEMDKLHQMRKQRRSHRRDRSGERRRSRRHRNHDSQDDDSGSDD